MADSKNSRGDAAASSEVRDGAPADMSEEDGTTSDSEAGSKDTGEQHDYQYDGDNSEPQRGPSQRPARQQRLVQPRLGRTAR